MELRKKKNYVRTIVFYTIITTIILCGVLYAMFEYINRKTEEEAHETLHLQTYTLKENINVQIASDMENLSTLSNFASNLYSNNKDYSLLFESFKPIGMIENIGILLPDNTFQTKAGISDVSDYIDYEKEVAKGSKISMKMMENKNAEETDDDIDIDIDASCS